MRAFIFSSFLCGIGFGQVGGPLIGYLPDSGRIRPMYGLPAAGAIGAAMDAGREFSHIGVAPGGTFVVAADAASGGVLIFKPGVGSTLVAGASANPDFIEMSPSGLSAALWFAATGTLQVVPGLPDASSVRTIDVSFLNASPLAAAVSDDGQWAAGIWANGVYAFGPNGEVIPLQTDANVVALAFFHNRHDLAFATAARATSIADVGGSMQTSVIYDYSALPLAPRGIAISFDNQRVLIADATGKLVNAAAGAGTAAIVDCGCSPDGVFGLGGSLFRLNGTGIGRSDFKSELKLFDASSGAVLIVPPALSLTEVRQ